ncbi:molybdate ABC transporter substrate-binding protein [bacterium SCSIO 12696]|nr:molybdate ABC transporter substrate-binding protein [bacterium SCSIO 12696]
MIRALVFLTAVWPFYCLGQTIDVAVASNFLAAAKALKADFEQRTEYRLKLVPGSTGKHYAQIVNGAPFDVFLAADSDRPIALEQQQKVTGKRFTYAVGRLVLWSQDPKLVSGGEVLYAKNLSRLAIANPKLAPYGRAAQQVLNALKIDAPNWTLLRGENINQALHFVHSGNAELGFVALSQLVALHMRHDVDTELGSYWLVPATLYDPIEQQAVPLSSNLATDVFMTYLNSPAGRDIIRRYGYQLPEVHSVGGQP